VSGVRPRTSPRAVLANLALVVVSLAAMLLLLEGVARVMVWRRVARPFTTRGSIVRYNPTLGWDKPPGAQAWLHRPEYSVHLMVNSKGLRGPDRPYAKPPGVLRTLILGDSFAEAYTVSEEQSVRARLEEELKGRGCEKNEVLNGGTIGYSTDQELLFYREEGRRYSPDVVVVLFCWNDIYFNTTGEQGKPFFELIDGQLVLRNSPVPPPGSGSWVRAPEPRQQTVRPWRRSMALRLLSNQTEKGNPELHRFLAKLGVVEPAKGKLPVPIDLWPTEIGHDAEVDKMWDITAALLAALKRDVESDNGRLVLFYIPANGELTDRGWQLSLEEYQGARRTWRRGRILSRLREVAQQEGIPLIDPSAPLAEAQASWLHPAYYPEDGHWNALGHAIAAREIARFLGEKGLVSCPPAAGR